MGIISGHFRNIKTAWQEAWKEKKFKNHFFLTLVTFSIVVRYCTLYISIWETRKGTILEDPLLHLLKPHDLSYPIFLLIHSSLFLSLIFLLVNPKRVLIAFQAYCVLLFVRTLTIYYVPLEPPPGMIYLNDPFIGMLINSVNVVTKDLFFSGHISTMCLFIYFSENKYWKRWLMFITPILAGMILWQHVHYTVDIMFAPIFGFACSKLVDMFNERSEYGLQAPSYGFDYEEAR